MTVSYSWLLCIILSSMFMNLYAQVNLVDNGGFEDLTSAHIVTNMTFEQECSGGGGSQGAFVFYDGHVIGTVYQLGIPENMFGYQEAYEGEKYGGIASEHYYIGMQTGCKRNGIIKLHLNSTLLAGYNYTLMFRVSKMDDSSIDPNLEVTLNDDQSVFDYTISDSQNWQEKIVQFTAENDYDKLQFEVTNTSSFTNDMAGVYLDDIQLYMSCQLEYPCLDIAEFIDPQFPESNIGPNSAFTIENLSNVHTCSLSVTSIFSQGQLVFTNTLNCEHGIASPVYWTGTSNSGNSVSNGFYTVSVHLTNVCGSRSFAGTLVKAADFTGALTEFACEDAKPPKPCCQSEPTLYLDGYNWFMVTLLFHTTEQIMVASTEPVIVNAGSNVVMRAGERIELLPGFSTIRPELFVAEIIPCPSLRLSGEEGDYSHQIIEISELNDPRGVDALEQTVLYPNPTTGRLTLQHPQTIAQMEAFDIFGRGVARTSPNSNNATIDLSGMAAGIYLIRATLEDGKVETHRAVLQGP
jgi:hypothetical protein